MRESSGRGEKDMRTRKKGRGKFVEETVTRGGDVTVQEEMEGDEAFGVAESKRR